MPRQPQAAAGSCRWPTRARRRSPGRARPPSLVGAGGWRAVVGEYHHPLAGACWGGRLAGSCGGALPPARRRLLGRGYGATIGSLCIEGLAEGLMALREGNSALHRPATRPENATPGTAVAAGPFVQAGMAAGIWPNLPAKPCAFPGRGLWVWQHTRSAGSSFRCGQCRPEIIGWCPQIRRSGSTLSGW